MAKKKTTKKAAASGGLTALQKQTVDTVIAPILLKIITEKNPTLTALLALFRKETGEKTSMATLRAYLKHLGWGYHRVPTWTGLPAMAEDEFDVSHFDPDTAADSPAFSQIDPLSALTS
jgi:hypothetical protein